MTSSDRIWTKTLLLAIGVAVVMFAGTVQATSSNGERCGSPPAGQGQGDAVSVLEARLPERFEPQAAFGDDEAVYVLGTDRVLRFTPSDGCVEDLGVAIDPSREDYGLAWTGKVAYLVGGTNGSTPLDGILRLDPTNRTLEATGTELPSPRKAASAVWTGKEVLVFGGYNGTYREGNFSVTGIEEVVTYEPATGRVEVQEATTHGPTWGTAAAWNGSGALLFGGACGSVANVETGFHTDCFVRGEIVGYRPTEDRSTEVDPPDGRWAVETPAGPWLRSAHLGDHVYLFGSLGGSFFAEGLAPRPDPLRYDLAAGALRNMTARMPVPVGAVATHGERLYLFYPNGSIVRYDSALDRPYNHPPKAAFTARTDDLTLVVNASRSRDLDGEIVRYTWRWGDGSSGSGQRAEHTYTEGGRYRVELAVTDGEGARSVAVENVSLIGTEAWPEEKVRLPTPRQGVASAVHGRGVYLFGGFGEGTYREEILFFSQSRERILRKNATLPSPRAYLTAVPVGEHIYLFGGQGAGEVVHDGILRYDPQQDELTRMNASLPRGLVHLPAWVQGDRIIVGPGALRCHLGCGVMTQVYAYDVERDALETVSYRSPPGLYPGPGAAVAPTRNGTYYLAADLGEGALRFVPLDRFEEVTLQGPPVPVGGASVWNGTSLLVLGGHRGTLVSQELKPSNDVLEFRPTDRTVRRVTALPSPMAWGTAVWLDDKVYLFGGGGADEATDRILVYDPARPPEPLDRQEDRRGLPGPTPMTVLGALVVAALLGHRTARIGGGSASRASWRV